jgi:hypothetical protein
MDFLVEAALDYLKAGSVTNSLDSLIAPLAVRETVP